MSWLSLASLAWLSLLAPLFALYVLRPSRVDKVVPSTFLWTTVARELSARHPWQRLRPFVSLLIQALALIAGALALARPSCGAGAPVGETIVVIVDASISMSARDRGGTRIEVAAERAAALTRGLGVGGHVMVIAAGPSPTLRLGPSRDAARVRQLVAQTPLVGASPRFDAAIELAAARLRAHRGPKRIVVLSDGAVTEPIVAVAPAFGGAAVVWLRGVGDTITIRATTLQPDGLVRNAPRDVVRAPRAGGRLHMVVGEGARVATFAAQDIDANGAQGVSLGRSCLP